MGLGELEDGPSFSLGLDLDLLSSPLSPSSSSSSSIFIPNNPDHDFTGRVLKRLRTGSRPDLTPHLPDDDVQPFSSQDNHNHNNANKASSSHPYSGCSTSKLSLHKHKVLTTHSIGEYKITQKQATVIPTSTNTWTNSKFTFPKLNASPLRKIQLLDSDSDSESGSDSDFDFDDPCSNEYANKKSSKLTLSSKAKLRNPSKKPTMSRQKRANTSDNVSQGHDLWDDFYMEKRFSISTPALDEVCEEYFKSVKNNRTDPPGKNVGNCTRENNDNDGVHRKLDGSVPPAHHYFYHDNPMVGNLVRSRLPYFFPLDTTNERNQQSIPSAIDYMSQFNNGASSTAQGSHMTNPDTSSKSAKKYSRKSNIAEVPEGSGGWVNPRSTVSIPTDAGKRRAHAVSGQSAGHWFTSPEGKKVYVSKTGKELTGRVAYTYHRKENVKGFKRSRGKKKGSGKKRSVVKKKTAAKNR